MSLPVLDTSAILRADELLIGYGGVALLPPLSFRIDRGEFWLVLGRNGSGKTTLFRTLVGLHPSLGGRVELASTRRLLIPQRLEYDTQYLMRAKDVVSLGLEDARSVFRPFYRTHDRVVEALKEVGAQHLANEPFASLSEGQKQRVLVARIVAAKPAIAFLDEPTAAMDVVVEREMLALLNDIRVRYQVTMVVISHAIEAVALAGTHAIFIDRDRQRLSIGTRDEVLADRAFREAFSLDRGESPAQTNAAGGLPL